MIYDEISDPFRRLVRIMERLQEPGGCPWDLEQTHESLKPYMIEEAYEALDAIDRGSDLDLAEELGDVLLQVVFHSVLAARTGKFNIDGVARGAATKMIRRHPHVFGDFEARTAGEVLQNWEKLKRRERKKKAADSLSPEKESQSLLSGIPSQLPALLRAQRMQEKASRVGFDWPETALVIDKVEEEVREMRQAIESGKASQVQDEFGDLLFSLVNVARFLKVDAEESLRQTCIKFATRFAYIEKQAAAAGTDLDVMSLEEMDRYWNEAKNTNLGA